MTNQLRNALPPDEPPRAEPMTDDQFRAWALGEAQRSNMTASDLAIDAWVRESAPDDLTIGAARALKGMVRGLVDLAVKQGFNAGTSRSGPKVK